MSLKQIAAGRSDVFKLKFADLEIAPGFNVRDMQDADTIAHIAWLKESIAAEGIKTPLRGYMNAEGSKFVITSGHCRHAAMAQLDAATLDTLLIPVMCEDKYSNEATRTAGILLDNSGKPLTALEKAAACRRLYNYNWTVEMIARAANFTRQHVDNLLTLDSATEDTKELIRAGDVKATTVMDEIKATDPDTAAKTLKTTVEKAKQEGKKATGKAAKATRNGSTSTTEKKEKPAKSDPLAELRELWADATTKRDNGNWVVTMKVADFERINEILLG